MLTKQQKMAKYVKTAVRTIWPIIGDLTVNCPSFPT